MTAVAAWRTGALGDFVLTLPVLHRLADLGPLTLVAPDRYRALFPRASRWLDSDGAAVTAWLAGRPPAWRFDHAIGWTTTACEALAQVADAVLRGTPHPPAGTHATDHLWRPLHELLGARDRAPRVIPPPGPASGYAGAVAIAPGSGGAAKRWPLARWEAVARDLPGVVWVGGPLESGERWPSPRVNPPEPASLARLAAEVAAWLGPDSGPSHLAAAVGARTGVVFTGATDPTRWAPIGATVWRDDVAPADVARWAKEAATRPTS